MKKVRLSVSSIHFHNGEMVQLVICQGYHGNVYLTRVKTHASLNEILSYDIDQDIKDFIIFNLGTFLDGTIFDLFDLISRMDYIGGYKVVDRFPLVFIKESEGDSSEDHNVCDQGDEAA